MYFKDYSRNRSAICFIPLLDFHTQQCCLYYDEKIQTNNPTQHSRYSYLAWIWHTVRSAIKGNFWFILIPVGKNHRWAIWPFEQGWHIIILETHPHLLFSICNLKLGQHCHFNIIFKLIGKQCVISSIVILFFLQWEKVFDTTIRYVCHLVS